MGYVIGIGCRRGTPAADIEAAVAEVLATAGIHPKDVLAIASCDVKRDEVGLLEYAAKLQMRVQFFTSEELDGVTVPNPSERVASEVGTASVCEAAAILAAGGRLIVEKQKFGNLTVAIAEQE